MGTEGKRERQTEGNESAVDATVTPVTAAPACPFPFHSVSVERL